MHKFDSQATRALYNSEPEDQIGASLDGFSWYGLYPANTAGGGFIVIEDTFGYVTRLDYSTTEDLYMAWFGIADDTETDYFAVSV